MQIFIQTLTRRLIPFDVEPSDTVGSLNAKIQETEGILPTQQRLVFAGKQLQCEQTLGDCGIHDHDIVYMILRLRG